MQPQMKDKPLVTSHVINVDEIDRFFKDRQHTG